MAETLPVGDRAIAAQEIIPLLASYQIMPVLLRESIIDRAIAAIECTPQEIALACQQIEQRWQLTSAAEKQAWLADYGMNQEQLELMATRRLRVEKFKQATWGHRLESHFLKRKRQLDRAIYSLLRTKDKWVAHELFFRLSEGEQPFAKLAREYSEGPEAETGGLLGPAELGSVHPNLAELLHRSQPGQVSPPLPFGEWFILVRLEKLIPAQFNEAMRQRLMNELFEAWLREQIGQLPQRDKIWLGVSAPRLVEPSSDIAVA